MKLLVSVSPVSILCAQLADLHIQTLEAQNLIHGQQSLKAKLQELETARTRAEDQVSPLKAFSFFVRSKNFILAAVSISDQ